jgi:hypothetical protein
MSQVKNWLCRKLAGRKPIKNYVEDHVERDVVSLPLKDRYMDNSGPPMKRRKEVSLYPLAASGPSGYSMTWRHTRNGSMARKLKSLRKPSTDRVLG